MNPSSTAKSPSDRIVPRAKIWFEREGDYVFGRGLERMLRAVADTGSIKAAAAEVSKSYRYVWGRIKAAEDALGLQLVEAHRGGSGVKRSTLSPAAVELMNAYEQLREQVLKSLETEFAGRLAKALKLAAKDQSQTSVDAS